ncbi:unnamed protein product [Didymodactylos carnosus]|uniref:UBX domain-containing protein 11 n=1 Tax=Didymodactylos carnosus TaxID=1234261 RepID=A0A814D3P3_9BILA|nr:unnamed protein product [Didymodactylos carnosus]CAF1181857.1 unnamed protein product [Didymodactylos carnosus]CAF3727445.1 unnamed protein product [Didymodactylos carnosus]CAF3993081.1 unnamed protein product [Didymodactylos carnosus]
MSSPFTTLSKYPKLPVLANPSLAEGNSPREPIKESVGYRFSCDEAKLMNEITTRMATDNIKANNVGRLPGVPLSQNSSDSRIRAPTDLDLLQLTMQRMQKAEADVRYLSSQIKEKDQRVAVLQDKLSLYEKALKNQRKNGDDSHKVQILEQKCVRLQSIIDRMEDLLIERGLEVVGESNEPDNINILTFDEADAAVSSSPKTWNPDESVLPQSLPIPIDYNAIIESIRELNVLAGESETRFNNNNKDTHNIKTLKRVDPVDLTLYANGIFLFNGPFRSFNDLLTKQFIKDLTDGYFPSELQTRYPDGVPFRVNDRREIYYKDKQQRAFQGEGHVLDDGRIVPSIEKPPEMILPNGAKVETQDNRPKVSVERFLNRLPQSVIKNGNVIDIRNDIKEQIYGNQQNQVDTSDRCESAKSEFDGTTTPITTLRIRSADGQQSYVIKMKITSTIEDVKNIITKKKKLSYDFDLFQMGTKTFYLNCDKTLEQCGLVPNASLGIREIKRQ